VSFGTDLREERARRGIDLSAIAERTKVSERYLRALEADEYDQLPGGIFNKGMVRGYCQALELDEEQWLERFSSTVEPPAGEPDWNSFAENVKRNRASVGASRRRWWGIVLMLLVLAALAWVLWKFVVKPRLG
jgi:cytoskeletal protein RodZ